MSEWRRILFVGVGGQGVLSAGKWIGDAAGACGVPVVVGQIHPIRNMRFKDIISYYRKSKRFDLKTEEN